MRFFFLVFIPISLQAQYVTQGPVIGAVTSSSARIYLRSVQPHIFKVELSAKENFEKIYSFSGKAREQLDNSVIIDLGGLYPNTTYHYRIFANETLDSVHGYFRTFPAAGEKG